MPAIEILLVDDHAIVRAGLKMLFAGQKDLQVTAEAERGEQALALLTRQAFDLMVLDLSMPGIGGLETLRRARRRRPRLRILVLSVHEEAVYQQQAKLAGANGFVSKSCQPEGMIEAIRTLALGHEVWPTARAVPEQARVVESFSLREFQVFCLLAKGRTVARIADELCLSHKTVANYGTRIRAKLKVSTVAELAHIARALEPPKNSDRREGETD